MPKGGPDGGDGGNGGSVWVEVDENQNTLQDFSHRQKFEAGDGMKGGSRKKSGSKGDDLVIKVPLGTVIRLSRVEAKDTDSRQVHIKGMKQGVLGKLTQQKRIVGFDEKEFDMNKPGLKILLAKGGRGGRGNVHFKSPRNTTPLLAEAGQKGEVFEAELELKLLADVGLIGLPNAGKSTLLSILTKARPKIASYAFTTLEPNLGVMNYKGKNLVIADIPGLIEGASSGKGLGIQFLRHIERTTMLVHLVSVESSQADKVLASYEEVRKELRYYSKKLAEKKELVVLNKIDLVDEKVLEKIKSEFSKHKIKVLAISCGNGEGVDKLMDRLIKDNQ